MALMKNSFRQNSFGQAVHSPAHRDPEVIAKNRVRRLQEDILGISKFLGRTRQPTP